METKDIKKYEDEIMLVVLGALILMIAKIFLKNLFGIDIYPLITQLGQIFGYPLVFMGIAVSFLVAITSLANNKRRKSRRR